MVKKWFVAMVLSSTVMLTGCAGIPTSGTVQQGSAVIEGDSGAIEFLPAGPAQDATRDQILRGFVDAASSPASDYAIAREFLTPDFAAKWDSAAGVQIDSGVRTFNAEQGESGTLSYEVDATVDGSGNYVTAPDSPQQVASYTFKQVDGQWRISSAPSGVIIDGFTFSQVYAPFPLYFFDSTGTSLVPDVRYFPAGSTASTRIMKALLAGAAPWLASSGATFSAFLPGTELAVDSVPVTRGVATVDLTATALGAGEDLLRKMKQQATASLLNVDNINQVELAIEGTVQEELNTVSTDAVLPRAVDARALVLGEDKFGYLTGASIEELPYLSPLVVASQPSAISVGTSTRVAAVLNVEGVSLIRAPGGLRLLDPRSGLIAPSLDSFNYVWSVPGGSPDALQAFSTDGTAHPIQTNWGEVSEIVSMSLSRDGTRLAAVVNSPSGYQLVVAAVTRGDKRVPTTLGEPKNLGPLSGIPIGVSWVDETSLAVLTHMGDGSSQVWTTIVGGSSENLEKIAEEGTLAIAGANTPAQLRVLTSEGTVLSLRGGTLWQSSGTGIRSLAVQQ